MYNDFGTGDTPVSWEPPYLTDAECETAFDTAMAIVLATPGDSGGTAITPMVGFIAKPSDTSGAEGLQYRCARNGMEYILETDMALLVPDPDTQSIADVHLVVTYDGMDAKQCDLDEDYGEAVAWLGAVPQVYGSINKNAPHSSATPPHIVGAAAGTWIGTESPVVAGGQISFAIARADLATGTGEVTYALLTPVGEASYPGSHPHTFGDDPYDFGRTGEAGIDITKVELCYVLVAKT